MIVYILLLAGTIALGIPLCRGKAGKTVYCILWGAAVFVIAAIRRGVGHDYNSYGTMYLGYMTQTDEEISVTRIEKGYAMINKLLADHFTDYQVIFVVVAAFFAVAAAVCVGRYCNKPYLGAAFFLTFGVYFNSLNFLRQTIAAFIVLYALRYIKSGQFFRYAVIVLFASCFHISALIMIPFWFILRIRMSYLTLGIYAGLTAVFMVFSWQILDFVTDYVYKGYDPRSSIHVTSGVEPTYMIFFGVFFILVFLLRKRLTENDAFANVLINCMFFTFFFELMGVKHSILSRFGIFFIVPAALLLMPRLFDAILSFCRERAKDDQRKRRLLSVLAVTAFAAVNAAMFGLMLAGNYNGVLPYRTVFDEIRTEADAG